MSAEFPQRELQYKDDPDRGLSEQMQNPDTIYQLEQLEMVPDSELLDVIAQSDLAQVPEEQLDIPVKTVLGKTRGPLRDYESIEIDTRGGTIIAFTVPKQTVFVRVTLQDGTDAMEVYDPHIHGPLNDLADLGCTPSELIEQLWGFGDTEVNQGWQFLLVRKIGASRKCCPIGHRPRVVDRTSLW